MLAAFARRCLVAALTIAAAVVLAACASARFTLTVSTLALVTVASSVACTVAARIARRLLHRDGIVNAITGTTAELTGGSQRLIDRTGSDAASKRPDAEPGCAASDSRSVATNSSDYAITSPLGFMRRSAPGRCPGEPRRSTSRTVCRRRCSTLVRLRHLQGCERRLVGSSELAVPRDIGHQRIARMSLSISSDAADVVYAGALIRDPNTNQGLRVSATGTLSHSGRAQS